MKDMLIEHGIGVGGNNVKSVQRGNTKIGRVSTLNIAISEVDLTKAIVKISPMAYSGPAEYSNVRATLTSSTNLELNIYNAVGSDVGESQLSWEVIEFNNVKSLQKGLKSVTGLNNPQAISEVDPIKSILFYSYSTSRMQTTNVNGYLNSSTQLMFSAWGAEAHSVAWQVIEFI